MHSRNMQKYRGIAFFGLIKKKAEKNRRGGVEMRSGAQDHRRHQRQLLITLLLKCIRDENQTIHKKTFLGRGPRDLSQSQQCPQGRLDRLGEEKEALELRTAG